MLGKRLLAVCLALPTTSEPTAHARAMDDDDFTVECPAGGLPLERLVQIACDATGEPFFYEPRDVDGVLIRFSGSVTFPRARFLSFFDACLRSVDFVEFERAQAGARWHCLVRLGQQNRGQQTLKTLAAAVPPERMADLADRGALVTTWFCARSNSMARTLGSTLCTYFTDSAIESIRNVEGSNVVLMTGRADNVARQLKMAAHVDAVAAQDSNETKAGELEARVGALEGVAAALRSSAADPTGR